MLLSFKYLPCYVFKNWVLWSSRDSLSLAWCKDTQRMRSVDEVAVRMYSR